MKKKMTKPHSKIDPKIIDELLKSYENPDDLLGEGGIVEQLTKALIERALQGEMTHHLGYEKHSIEGYGSGNSRNGTTSKTLKGKKGKIEVEVPRDRTGEFEPQLIKKHQRRFDGFDEKIISLYARGMTVREIQGPLQEIYGVESSSGAISNVTDEGFGEVKGWRARPLEEGYPVLWVGGLRGGV